MKFLDRTRETFETIGPGTLDLLGAPAGFRRFVTANGGSGTVFYFAVGEPGGEDSTKWEFGFGTLTEGGPDTLTRTLIASSSGALIAWSAGSKIIMSTPIAEVFQGLLSGHRGTTRPPWLPPGGVWTDTTGSPLVKKHWDGAQDIPVAAIDETDNTHIPYFRDAPLNTFTNVRVAITADTTLTAAHNGKTLECLSASMITVTLGDPTLLAADFVFNLINASSTRAVKIVHGVPGSGYSFLFPRQDGLFYRVGTEWRANRPDRWKIPANTTIYVSPTGDDTKDGLAVGDPITLGTAVDRVCYLLDFNRFQVTVKLADGTYNTVIWMHTALNWVGGGNLVFQGNTSVIPNVVVDGSAVSNHGVNIVGVKSGPVRVEYMKLKATYYGIVATHDAYVQFSEIHFDTAGQGHIAAFHGGFIEATGNWGNIGNAPSHMVLRGLGRIVTENKTHYVSGTFSGAYIDCWDSTLSVYGMVYSGAAVGPRFNIHYNSTVFGTGGSLTFFPGNAAGSIGSGSQMP